MRPVATRLLLGVFRHDYREYDVQYDARKYSGKQYQCREGDAHQCGVQVEVIGKSAADAFDFLIFGRFVKSFHSSMLRLLDRNDQFAALDLRYCLVGHIGLDHALGKRFGHDCFFVLIDGFDKSGIF